MRDSWRTVRRGVGTWLRRVGLYALLDRLEAGWERRVRPHRRRGFYRRFLRPGDLCFDIGANRGEYTQLFLSHGSRVVCVEPLSVCQDALRRRFEGREDVVLVNRGLGAEEGERTIVFDPASSDVASMSPEHIGALRGSRRLDAATYGWSRQEHVAVTTLDRLIEQFGLPAFCKIDVEGFELEVLRGLTRALPALSFEYIPERIARADECIRRLMEIGDYRFNYSLGESMRLYLRRWAGADRMRARLADLARWPVHGDIYARLEVSDRRRAASRKTPPEE